MTCSMFGAWGSATPDGNLIQLRSLDFGDTPFSNYTVVVVRHPSAARDAAPSNSFAAVSLPSWTGAVTGFSKHIAISEKVWETYDKPDVQPGHYDGEPVALVLRDILQFSNDRADAISFAQHIKRTWAVFVGVGDSASQRFTAMGYREKDLEVFDPANISTVTHMPVVDDVVYIDKHPQPSHDQATMPKLLQAYHGHIDARAAINISRVMGSGDMHIAVYDFGARKACVHFACVPLPCGRLLRPTSQLVGCRRGRASVTDVQTSCVATPPRSSTCHPSARRGGLGRPLDPPPSPSSSSSTTTTTTSSSLTHTPRRGERRRARARARRTPHSSVSPCCAAQVRGGGSDDGQRDLWRGPRHRRPRLQSPLRRARHGRAPRRPDAEPVHMTG